MLRRLLYLAASLPAVAVGQAPGPSYFPLDVGDMWTYAVRAQTSPTEWDTLVGTPREIARTVTVNDTVYTEAVYPHAVFGALHRVDEAGRVWVRADGADRLLFDVTQEDGGTYTVPDGYGYAYVVTVQTGVTADTYLGRFEDAIAFSFDIPEALDDEMGFVLAPGVGVVVAAMSFLGDYRLYAASVGGRVVTAGDEAPADASFAVAAPNPFSASTTIRLPDGPAGHARVEVFDLLGRQMAVLLDGPVGAGGHVATWSASGVPAGVYVVRVRRGGRTQSLRVVRG